MSETKKRYSINPFMNKLAETILESDVKLNGIQRGRLQGLFAIGDEYTESRSKIDEKGLLDVWEMPNFTIISVRNTWKSSMDEEPILFMTYIKGQRQNEVSYNFDDQLLISLGLVYDGSNSRFPSYAHRMLDMSKKYN